MGGGIAKGLAGLTALAAVWAATCTGASAHDYDYESRDAWYAAYDRQQAARERRRTQAEERAYKRVMAHQDYLSRRRDRIARAREDAERRWTRDASLAYRDYERYCDDCSSYREYAEGPRVYGYTYGHAHFYGRSHHGYDQTHNGQPFGYPSGYSLAAYPNIQLEDRVWKAEAYPAGWSAWWTRMDREGRAGQGN